MGLNPFNTIFGAFSRDLGIDLGTANTLVHVRGKGIVISEPSVVAIDTRTKKVHAVGAEAKAMVGKTPANIVAVRPLKDGVIADFDVVEQMLAYFIKKAHTYAALPLIDPRPRVVVGVPSGVTEVEKRAAREAALNAKAREAYVVEEPMAAAIGAGLPVEEPIGSMIVDIGGGTTEIAVIALGGIVINHSIRIAGDEIDEAIIQFARREYNLLIGERMAEKAKIAAGSAYPLDEEIKVVLRGRDLLTGLPKAIEVSSVELREGIAGPVNAIVAEVRAALEETPPELVADIMEHGIMLAGGGSLLHGLDKRIAAETKMPVHIAQDPLSCVARGAGKMVEHFDNSVYQDILMRTQTTRRVRR
ncbi:MAG TPA: rod shape-determining protein [Chloroflexus aurantiacus]|uniref:Cell shape-determining protein MreB n=1 Tax=Chloroflexus aurantiacus (strain ATCC 29366 / DSM 635 / J-10-fl) TaxID=324602 RepID=A9WBG3_CHLAA|nr:rod shape-determining protein [Chloroflexus aurantiacus]ABY33370.1 cell shape determining protein, MreB/Mrl family [Chloroflexus aurantiacus J-10-fl]RMG46528.1 MAG: rod shape-determining protein [Chloroflexota bacterium]GIV92968.1 MAG: rod shape-determining protein [Chloroflexus sp.]HBW66736.1 rod shape-determining protein [Chloroflexus aurantiacus]